MTITQIAHDTGDWIHIDEDSWTGTRQDWAEAEFALCQLALGFPRDQPQRLFLFGNRDLSDLLETLADTDHPDRHESVPIENLVLERHEVTDMIKDIRSDMSPWARKDPGAKLALDMLFHGLRHLRKQLRCVMDCLYVLVDNLDIGWREDSARGYDIQRLELVVRVGDGYREVDMDHLKANLDAVILDKAHERAQRGWGEDLNGFSVAEIGWQDEDGGLHPLGDDWEHSVMWTCWGGFGR